MEPVTEAGRPRQAYARIVGVTVVLALFMLAGPGRAVADEGYDAGTAVELMNKSRDAYGLDRLVPDGELQAVANRQALRMADANYIFHTPDLGDQIAWGWWAWAENVGYGPSVNWVHDAFMASSHHASNILDPSYNYVGVGVAYGRDGKVYVAEVFGAW